MKDNLQSPGSKIEHLVERFMFQSRWLLLPFYIGLIVGLFILMINFWGELLHMISTFFGVSKKNSSLFIKILHLIDLTLLANLVVIVILSGYESFVSRIITSPEERPIWMGKINFTGLKVALMGSLAAISGIYLLEAIINLKSEDWVIIILNLAIHLTFVISVVVFAVVRKIESAAEGDDS